MAHNPDMTQHTGRELRLAREALDVTQTALAKSAARRPEWVTRLEASRDVTSDQARRYIEALSRCATTQLEEVA